MSLTKREAFQSLITTQDEDIDDRDGSVFQNDNSFRIKVLSGPRPYSGPATAISDPETIDKSGIDSKYMFSGRIIDPRMPHHKFLPDPCDEATSPNPAAGTRIYALHTNMRLSKAGQIPQFQPGDIIEGRMQAGDLTNLYDLQFADFDSIKEVFQNQSISKAGACAKLGNIFAAAGAASGAGGTGFVGNVAGIPLTASDKLTQTAAEPKLITILRNKGYQVYEDGSINSIGVRSSNRVPDKFDDVMHLIWLKDGMWNDIAFQITTDPGSLVIRGKVLSPDLNFSYAGTKGAAQLKEGQYVDGWKFGSHRKKYKALTQTGPNAKAITVYRDNNLDNVLDWESSGGGAKSGRFGINIHKAGTNSQQVGANSAGCQVFQKSADFAKAMGIWESTGQTSFTYTLLLWSDLSGADSAVASTERPWSTDPADGWLPASTPPETDPQWGTEGIDWGYTA